MWSYIIYYLLFINILWFIIFGVDKYKARKSQWRIKENHLLLVSLLWWFIGSLLGMTIFHHKTIKNSFQLKFYTVVLIWLVAIVIIVSYQN